MNEAVIALPLERVTEAMDRDDRRRPRRVELGDGLVVAQRDADQAHRDAVHRRHAVDGSLHRDTGFRDRQHHDRHRPTTERAIDVKLDPTNIRTQWLETELAPEEAELGLT